MPDFKSAAVVAWVSDGASPSIRSFEQADEANVPKTQGFWEAGAALIVAVHSKGPERTEAWVKIDHLVLSPDECLQAYERFKNGGSLSA